VLTACVCASLLFLVPAVLLTVSIRAFFAQDVSGWLAADTLPPAGPKVAVDGYELSAMDAQWLSRLQSLLVTRRTTEQ
jgi:hypothetical protein